MLDLAKSPDVGEGDDVGMHCCNYEPKIRKVSVRDVARAKKVRQSDSLGIDVLLGFTDYRTRGGGGGGVGGERRKELYHSSDGVGFS